MRLRLALGALLLLALGGCSLVLDFGQEGHPCDDAGRCLPGFVCDGTNTCVKEGSASAQCKPACGAFQTCVKSQCVAVCDGRGCAAGQTCTAGKCQALAGNHALGAPCDDSSDCSDGTFCLRPYGGGSGVCTKACDSDASCAAPAGKCKSFRATRASGVKLCVADSFLDCSKESDCTASGLSCGVYLAAIPTGGDPLNEPVTACRARVAGGIAITEECSGAIKCGNGICVQSNAQNRYVCSTPCEAAEDCSETIKDPNVQCAEVTLKLPYGADLAKTRPKLCVPGGFSQLKSCESSADVCTADGPLCLPLPSRDTPSQSIKECTTLCGDGPDSEKCPSGQRCISVDNKKVCAQ